MLMVTASSRVAIEAETANTPNARMWPTRLISRSQVRDPARKPTKYAENTMPMTNDGTLREAIWMPITAPMMPSEASIRMMPNNTGMTGCTAFSMTRSPASIPLPMVPPPPRWGRVGVGEASDDCLTPKRGFPLPTSPSLGEEISVSASSLFDQRRLPALQQAIGDDEALDLARAFPDALHPQLAIESLGHVLAHVAAAAEDLHRAVGDPARHLRGIELHHGALRMAHFHILAGVDRLGRAIDHQARGPQLGQAVGQHELDRLLVGQLLPENGALLGEGCRFVDQPRGCAAAARADHQALVAEPVAGEAHAIAFLADAIGGGHAHILEAIDRMMCREGVRIGR